jgi:hypothetical protein
MIEQKTCYYPTGDSLCGESANRFVGGMPYCVAHFELVMRDVREAEEQRQEWQRKRRNEEMGL